MSIVEVMEGSFSTKNAILSSFIEYLPMMRFTVYRCYVDINKLLTRNSISMNKKNKSNEFKRLTTVFSFIF